MKKIINAPADVVAQTLAGLALAHPDLLAVHTDPTFVVRRRPPVPGLVAVLSGGGSGHEPLHTGYVGVGMLAAAVPGAVFTSPTPDQILAATHAVDGGAGVLYIVKNYTGDVLNFEVAAELATAAGLTVRTVLIADDVAVTDSTWTVGRRGVGGAVLTEKILGAAAERGDDLAGILALGARIQDSVRSMGVALSACTVPHSGEPSFDLGPDEIEVGIGIHGEPGRERSRITSADELVATLLDGILADRAYAAGAPVLLLVNGMGGTPLAELYLAYRSARTYLAGKGIPVARSLVGNYITALEMQGMSVTLLALNEELIQLWDAPVHTAALRWGV